MRTETPILLDTCAAIWLMSGAPLSFRAVEVLQSASASQQVLTSPITAWEVSMLVSKGRLALTTTVRVWFTGLTTRAGVSLAELTPDILIAANELPHGLHSDPVDRILAATAREQGYRLMTRDRALLGYAKAGHLQAIPC